MMEARTYRETLATVYQSRQRHIQENFTDKNGRQTVVSGINTIRGKRLVGAGGGLNWLRIVSNGGLWY
jgi:hypothetical protein